MGLIKLHVCMCIYFHVYLCECACLSIHVSLIVTVMGLIAVSGVDSSFSSTSPAELGSLDKTPDSEASKNTLVWRAE